MVQNHAPTGLCQMVDIGSQHCVTLFGQLNMFVHHMHDYIAILRVMLGFDATRAAAEPTLFPLSG